MHATSFASTLYLQLPCLLFLIKIPPQVLMNLETIYHLCHWAKKHEEKQEVRHHMNSSTLCA